MSHLGMGVMINLLAGNEKSVEAYNAGLNKRITEALVENNTLTLKFTDGYELRFVDDGQSCCESRYMVCDDDLSKFRGAVFLSAGIKNAPDEPDECGVHEVQFLEIKTTDGDIVVANHNEHNGYYGGFSITCHGNGAIQKEDLI